jgi:transcriptional regulator GlxA family with amidase domain
MVLFTRRGAQDPARSPYLHHRNHLNEEVLQVQDLIQADPTKSLSLTALAEQLLYHTSSKCTFQREFKAV